jgi:hypothetical protein
MLRRILVLALLLLPVAAGAQTPADIPAPDRAAIRQVISDQIAAFRRDDGPGAFAYASPMIQNMFGTPELFMDMVRNGYPPVYRPQRFEFARLVWMDGQLTQLVDIVGPDGIAVTAAYAMELQPNGVWRINGCRLLRPRDQSA